MTDQRYSLKWSSCGSNLELILGVTRCIVLEGITRLFADGVGGLILLKFPLQSRVSVVMPVSRPTIELIKSTLLQDELQPAAKLNRQ